MGTTVDVRFNKESKVYWAGEMVTGTVIVVSDDEKCLRLIKGLRVRCKSFATVDLKFGGSEVLVHFIDEDAKLLTDKLVKTETTKKNVVTVRYEYPFQFQLNKDIPSSFNTPYGRIEYLCKASLPSGGALSYFEGRGYFNVIGLLDLNTKKSLKQPVELKLESTMTTLLHSVSGIVIFNLRLPHKAYAIGDKILMHQEIENKSKQHVKANISLIQKITYEIMGHARLDKENKMKILGKEIAPDTVDITDDQTFEIPQYEVTSRPGWTNKMKGYIPITIGSIGFRKDSIENIHKKSI